MLTIGLTELRRGWYEVLLGVLSGQRYSILRGTEIIAELVPACPPQSQPGPGVQLDPEIVSTLRQIETLLGAGRTARALGVPAAFLALAQESALLPTYLHPKLDALHDLTDRLAVHMTPSGARRWWETQQPQLDGQNPAGILSGNWTPRSAAVVRLQQLTSAELR